MDIIEFYSVTGGDYETTIANLKSQERIIRFSKRFIDEPSFASCENAILEKDAKKAFLASHTIKGICQNLGFAKLQRSSSELTESLRDGTFKDNSMELFEQMKKDYLLIIDNLKKLD